MKNITLFSQILVSRAVLACMFFATICLTLESGFAQQRGWDPAEYLLERDRNNNGQMDPDEMEGRLKRYIGDLGFSTDQPVPIADVINRARNGKEREETKGKSSSNVTRKVPGFGEAADSGTVQGFSGGESNDPRVIEREFSEKIMERVRDTLRRYDRDESGSLEGREIKQARWGRPGPKESDLNGDGILSTRELAMRYQTREDGSSDNRSDDRERAKEAARRSAEKRESEKSNEGDRRQGDRGDDDRRGRYRESSGKVSDAEGRMKAKERAREELERKKREAAASLSEESTTNSDSRRDSGGSSTSNRYEKFVNGLMKQMDKDGDDALSTEEMKRFRRPPTNADGNGDGSVTREELIAAYSARAGVTPDKRSRSDEGEEEAQSSRSRSGNSRNSNPSKSRTSSRGFSGRDENGDGLLQMHEFAKPNEWTMEKIDEFKAIDLNNDGILDSDEYRNQAR